MSVRQTGFIILLAFVLLPVFNLYCGEKIRVDLVPAADGILLGSSVDNVYGKVCSTINDSNKARQATEINVGEIWGNNRKIILEFIFPEKLISSADKVKSAYLMLWPNGKWGRFPDSEGSGPEVKIFYYSGANVDEKVSKEDNDGGKELSVVLAKDLVLTSAKPVKINILPAISEILKNSGEGLGLRLERTQDSAKSTAWRFRSCEFGQKHGKDFAPHIIVELE